MSFLLHFDRPSSFFAALDGVTVRVLADDPIGRVGGLPVDGRTASAVGLRQASGETTVRYHTGIYVLRNQLRHGGATWNGAANRSQVRDGAAILGHLLPLFIDLMMDNPDEDWAMPLYPVIDN